MMLDPDCQQMPEKVNTTFKAKLYVLSVMLHCCNDNKEEPWCRDNKKFLMVVLQLSYKFQNF